MRTPITALRHQLAATILLTFLLVVGIALVHLDATQLAYSAVTAAARSYDRVVTYSRLSSAAEDLNARAFLATTGRAADAAALQEGASTLAQRLDQTQRLSFAAPNDEARLRIIVEGRTVLQRLSSFTEVAPQLSRIGRKRGFAGVRERLASLMTPSDLFRRDLTAEIVRAEAEISTQTLRVQRFDAALRLRLIAVLGVAILATSLALLFLLTRLKRGLDALERGTGAVSAGRLGHRIALRGRDELARLAASFDAMAEELGAKQLSLERLNASLEATVQSRTRELSTANSALAMEDQNRRRFMADVGHELRTPLTIIRGEAQLALRAADRGGVDTTPIFDRILDQTHALERLVSDLFLIARAESHGLKLARRPTDLSELACKVAADFDGLAVDGLSTIRARVSGPVVASVDSDRVVQMLSALIDNAMRHTEPGVSIEVVARMDAGRPTLCVCDDGPGVPPEDAELLFNRFHRGRTKGEGSGLGLAVVRALADAHGGSAHIEQNFGGGFCMRLDFQAVAHEAISFEVVA